MPATLGRGSGSPAAGSSAWRSAPAFCRRKSCFLLDEPTAGGDPQAPRDFCDEIHSLAGEGLTALVSTHYMDESERCHELAFISAGALSAKGPVERILADSPSPS